MCATILEADLYNQKHASAIWLLLNAYAEDPLGQGKPLPETLKPQLIKGLKDLPTTRVFLAFLDQKPAAVAICFEGYSTFNAKKLLNIHDFAVLPQFRGKGLGKKLMHFIIDDARKHNYCKITLEVRQDNEVAKSLYQQCGFNSGDADYQFWTCPLTPEDNSFFLTDA